MSHSFDWGAGYASQRLPIFGRNVVATSHPLAAQAGLRMLAQGGNAVDAAIATAAAMTIVEPVSNGLGSDAFCILWDGRELHGLNASGRAPQAWTPEYFRRKYGPDAKSPPKRGCSEGVALLAIICVYTKTPSPTTTANKIRSNINSPM